MGHSIPTPVNRMDTAVNITFPQTNYAGDKKERKPPILIAFRKEHWFSTIPLPSIIVLDIFCGLKSR